MPSGQVLHAAFGDVWVLKFVGSIGYTSEWTFPLSKSLRAFIDELFAYPRPGKSIVVDLTETTGMDSTNLGLLAQVAKRSSEMFGTTATIIAKHGNVMRVLETMAFPELCTVLSVEDPIRGNLAALPEVPDSQVDVARMILEAHRTLAGMSEENRRRFRVVIEAIERDIERKRPQAQ